MIAPHDNNHHQDPSEQSAEILALLTPLSLHELNTPDSRLSLEVSPSDLTPATSPTYALVAALNKFKMHETTKSRYPANWPSQYPQIDHHNKLQADTPQRSRTTTTNSAVRAFSSSKMLHQVLSMRDPEPFAMPPVVPHDLEQIFEAGLQEYGQLFAAGLLSRSYGDGLRAKGSFPKNRTDLADILEEKESPQRATPVKATNGVGFTIPVPKCTSAKQAIAVAPRHTFLESDSEGSDHAEEDDNRFEFDQEDESPWRYGSSTTLAVSDYSRPGSATSEDVATVPARSFPLRTSSLLSNHYNYSSSDVTAQKPCRFIDRASTTSQSIDSHKQSYDSGCSELSPLRKAEKLSAFPQPPGAQQQQWDFVQTINGFAAGDFGYDTGNTYSFSRNSPPKADDTDESRHIPQINIQAPSPQKLPTSRKRAPSYSTQSAPPPRLSDTTGLPTLPTDAEALWKFKFPGNTHALLTILLTWCHTMWTFHTRLPDPKLFAIHPAFPHSIAPPLRRQLLSVAFYDTSIEPHREVRFLGPGDAAEISYHEVDVFDAQDTSLNDRGAAASSCPIGMIKQTLGLTDADSANSTRYVSMAQRAKTGQGRWCYVLIKGHQTSRGETPPHVILAWHVSAVTASSECLHTIYPDDNATFKPLPFQPQSKVRRLSSLQNFSAAVRSSRCLNFRQTLRMASSNSELSSVDARVDIEQSRATTLHRSVLKLEKAGRIPLIEGFRVDVAAFREWLEACGRGRGKVIMWRERDGG